MRTFTLKDLFTWTAILSLMVTGYVVRLELARLEAEHRKLEQAHQELAGKLEETTDHVKRLEQWRYGGYTADWNQ